MSTLVVVRHGQASFFAADYDHLSPLGQRQSLLLGRHWARRAIRFDEVYTGPRRRHLETARLAGEQYADTPVAWPQAQVADEFDEYAAEAVLKESLPTLVEQDASIRELHAAVGEAKDRAETLRNFQRMYEVIIGRWAHGALELPGIEPWGEFCERVEAGLARIVRQPGRSRRVAVITSGGPVGVAMQQALGVTAKKTLELAWMVPNAAVSEFLYTPDKFTLSRFNSLAHLDDPDLVTYR